MLHVQALPMCLLVHFTAADLEESRGNTDNSRQIYDDLIQATLPKSDAAEPDASAAKSTPEVRRILPRAKDAMHDCKMILLVQRADVQPYDSCLMGGLQGVVHSPCISPGQYLGWSDFRSELRGTSQHFALVAALDKWPSILLCAAAT